jgi:cytochrome c oxidase cbb3-type subunit III
MADSRKTQASAGGQHIGKSRIDGATGVETVGHEWDGIEELNNPLPRWWVWANYLSILFALGYVIVYPAIPLLSKGTEGLWGWTSRGQLAAEAKVEAARRGPLLAALAATPTEQLAAKPELMRNAVAGGRAAFRVNCVQCHGAGAAGSTGYPNLNDDEWLWGGNIKEIEQTITHGIRQPGDRQTRTAQLMPSFGRDGILSPAQIADTASYVRTLAGKEPAGAASARGAAIYANNCVTCHGPLGQGDRLKGAPNLTDAIWLYGGSRSAIEGSVANAHAGVMPAWTGKLDPVTIKMLAAYVHSLGGGEDFADQPTSPLAAADAQP